MTPLISIIVPVYRVEKYLDKCVESIVNQSYKKLEIILVDDGSPDACPDMCNSWAEKDERIRVIHKKNGGLSSARNAGLEIASGDYICFVDSDDRLDDDAVETMLNGMEEHGADICVCGFYIEHLSGESETAAVDEAVFEKDDIVISYILDKIRPEVCNKMYRASLIGGLRFDESVKYAEDVYFNYEIMKRASCVYSLGKPKYHYLQNSGNSITTDFITDARAESWQVFEKIVLDCRENAALCEAAVYRFIVYIFGVLSRVLLKEEFSKKYYGAIADKILEYKAEVKSNRYLGKKHKLSVRMLSVSRLLFKKVFLLMNKDGGIIRKAKLNIAKIVFGLQTAMFAVKANILKIKHGKNFVFFVLTPCHENYGDQALAYAGSEILKEHFVFEITGDLLSRFVNYPAVFKGMIGKSTVVFQGGGYLGTFWFDSGEKLLRSVLELVPNNRMIVLPQSIYYDETEFGRKELENSKKIYSRCPNLILTARDKTSFELMKEYYPQTKTYLIPDVVLSLNKCEKGCKRSGAMLTLRNDVEKNVNDEMINSVTRLLKESFADVRKIDMLADRRISPESRERELDIQFARFRESELVVTDRLHGMIFSAVTGTPCVVFNSKSHKVRGVYEWLLSDCEYIIFTENLNEIKEFIEFIKGKEFTYSNEKTKALFDELKSFIK